MARLALSFLLFLSLLSLTLARHLTPDDESTSIISVDLPAFSSGPRSYEEATRYIIVPVGRFSEIKSFDNLNDLGFFLHNQQNGGFGHRYMTDREVNPAWIKPDGESVEMPRVPMHMQRWQDAEMNGEEYTKEYEEEEMSMEEMEKLRELRKKMRKCRKHRMERLRGMRMPHEQNHGIHEREYNQERQYNGEIKMDMPYRHHHERGEEMEMRMPYRSNGNEREETYLTEMGMDYRNSYERKDKDEMEMRMGMPYIYRDDQYARPDQSDFWYPYPPASAPAVSEFPQSSGTLSHERQEIEKEDNVEKEAGGVLEQVLEFFNTLRNP